MLFITIVLSWEPLFKDLPSVRFCLAIGTILDVTLQGLGGIFRSFVSLTAPAMCLRIDIAPSLSWFAFSPLIPGAIKQDLHLTADQVRKYP